MSLYPSSTGEIADTPRLQAPFSQTSILSVRNRAFRRSFETEVEEDETKKKPERKPPLCQIARYEPYPAAEPLISLGTISNARFLIARHFFPVYSSFSLLPPPFQASPEYLILACKSQWLREVAISWMWLRLKLPSHRLQIFLASYDKLSRSRDCK